MASSSRRSRSGNRDRMRSSKLAPLSVFALLLSGFAVAAFRSIMAIYVLAFILVLLSLFGYICGAIADRAIRRHHGVIQGHAAALIGKWGNLGLLVLSALLFAFSFLRALMNGEIL